ncbi:MAG: Ig-like domain-containing protein [Aminobacteriaceae bacterium]
MFSKRFFIALVILCALTAGLAFASNGGDTGNTAPKVVISAVGDVVIYEEGAEQPLYALLMGVGEEYENRILGGIIVSDDEPPVPFPLLWTTSDWQVARIAGQTGPNDVIVGDWVVIEAMSEGTATITACHPEEEENFATCMVYVQNPPVPVEKVIINKEEIAIFHGYTGELTASVLPPHAEFRHLTWHSSNPEIIQIDPATRTGNRVRLLTTGLHPGTAYVSALSVYTGGRGKERIAAQCTVHHYVEGPAEVEGGCSAQGLATPAILLLLSPLLFFLKR